MASRPAPRNRNDTALGLARVRAAATFSTPAPKVNSNIVPQKPKDPAEYSAALRELAQYRVAGARVGSYLNRDQLGIEAVFDPITAVSGGVGLVTTDYNPKNIKYPTRMVPAGARGGGMVSGGGPGIGSSFAGIGAALYGAIEGAPTTEFDAAMQDKYKNNPRAIAAALQRLSPEQKSDRKNQKMIVDREEEYNDLLRTLKAAGLTVEEWDRGAVVSPDGRVNLNPNAQATIAQLGNAADSLRLLDFAGLGAGKVVGAGVGYGARAATRGIAKGLIPTVRSVKARGIPLPVPVGVGGVPIIRVGGNKPVAGAARSRLLPSGKEKELNRVAEARASEGFIENKPTPEVVGATRFGGAETSKLSPEALEERASTAAEYVSPEELADELSVLENMGFATVDKIPAKSVGAVSLSQKELADRTAAALSGIKKRERAVNAAREARGEEPFEYEPHFDPYDLTKKELETLWGGNPIYVYNEAGELIPELGAHLGHGRGKSLKYGYSATLGSVRGQRGVANMRYGSEF